MKIDLVATREWLVNVIIGLKLCPFVSIGMNEPKLITMKYNSEIEFNEDFFFLAQDPLGVRGEYHALHIYPEYKCSFEVFYQQSQALQEVFDHLGITAEIVCFHPDFKFEGMGQQDRVNFVNRSPFPTLHIIGSSLMNKALIDKEIDFGERISLSNSQKFKEMSESEFEKKVVKYTQGFWNV